MCIFASPGELLGTPNIPKWSPPNRRKSQSHYRSSCPPQCFSVEVLPGHVELLQQVLSTVLAPLYSLLHKNAVWQWGTAQQTAFSEAKKLLISSKVFVHFDVGKPLFLSCDALPYDVGAVLSHKLDDGSEQPVAFASRSLLPAKRKYSQLDKEGLAIIFGVKRFYHYLLGRKFTIYSDHKPLPPSVWQITSHTSNGFCKNIAMGSHLKCL